MHALKAKFRTKSGEIWVYEDCAGLVIFGQIKLVHHMIDHPTHPANSSKQSNVEQTTIFQLPISFNINSSQIQHTFNTHSTYIQTCTNIHTRCPLAAPCEAQGHRSQEKSCSGKCRPVAECRGTMPCCGTMPRQQGVLPWQCHQSLPTSEKTVAPQ